MHSLFSSSYDYISNTELYEYNDGSEENHKKMQSWEQESHFANGMIVDAAVIGRDVFVFYV